MGWGGGWAGGKCTHKAPPSEMAGGGRPVVFWVGQHGKVSGQQQTMDPSLPTIICSPPPHRPPPRSRPSPPIHHRRHHTMHITTQATPQPAHTHSHTTPPPRPACLPAGLDAEAVELLCASLDLLAMQGLCDTLADASSSAADRRAAVQQQLATVQVRHAQHAREWGSLGVIRVGLGWGGQACLAPDP